MSVEADIETPAGAPPTLTRARPFYWSVRRELWENSSLYIAPMVAAGVALLGYLISAAYLPRMAHYMAEHPAARAGRHTARSWPGVDADPAAYSAGALAAPYQAAAGMIMVTGVIVAMFYCLGALNGERRDRSILFWKSLPVSDRTTVLSKAAVPLIVTPITIFAIAVAANLVTLLLNAIVLIGRGKSAVILLTDLPLVEMWVGLAYGVVALALWQAPIYAWLLLVSGWARRATLLWAVLPPLAISVLEGIAFQTGYFGQMVGQRLAGGGFGAAFSRVDGRGMTPDPLKYLSAPGLWIGLVIAAGFLAAAIWRRRSSEPN